MQKTSLKNRLVVFLTKHQGWMANGELQRIVAQKTTYTPRSTARRLEEAVEEGKLEVDYRKGHAWYRARPDPVKASIEWFDSLPA